MIFFMRKHVHHSFLAPLAAVRFSFSSHYNVADLQIMTFCHHFFLLGKVCKYSRDCMFLTFVGQVLEWLLTFFNK